ncbi:hypothetical protein LXT21_44575 [Myxococcus sp. K38C18041901]|uniref:hypothetical protein n=1 Tax=Myxococcus guangdongensis TaxID=2906760 RepID=UPI0020A7C139|nr:hypothetical protein [Myxococcus guangdongensis]MCP3065861.1 hypothetical protein [Myxococcus guangdongensis]
MNSRQKPPEISLESLVESGAVILVDHPEGFLYSNQTHDVACRHSEAMGYLLPLPCAPDLFMEACWNSWSEPPPPDLIARLEAGIEALRQDVFFDFRIEPHPDNGEAWLRCSFLSGPLLGEDITDTKSRAFRLEGWLTWSNCD